MQEGVGSDISHGICQSCYSSVLSVRSTSLKEYIEKLPVPVLAVNDLGRAAFSNSKAQALVGKEADLIHNELGGDIFECIHSKKSGGCGKTIHCKGCTIRNCVEDTFATGEPHIEEPATLKVVHNATERDVVSKITTIKVEVEPGEYAVLLTIRDFHFKE